MTAVLGEILRELTFGVVQNRCGFWIHLFLTQPGLLRLGCPLLVPVSWPTSSPAKHTRANPFLVASRVSGPIGEATVLERHALEGSGSVGMVLDDTGGSLHMHRAGSRRDKNCHQGFGEATTVLLMAGW